MTKLKWCIKRTPENYKEVNEWANKTDPTFGNYKYYRYYIHSEPDGIRPNLMAFQIRPDFHKINLDEFRLLTDPEKYKDIMFSQFNEHSCYTCIEGKGIYVSNEVMAEFGRMWKERESEPKSGDVWKSSECGSKVAWVPVVENKSVNETADGVEEIQVKNTVSCSYEFPDLETLQRDLLEDKVISVSELTERMKEIEFLAMWQNQMELSVLAMNKVSKALTKQNKLLKKLIKKQKHQF